MNSTTDHVAQSRRVNRRVTLARSLAPAVVSVALFIFALAWAVQAQSGRRAPRTQEIAPVPTPTPEPTPKKQETEVVQKINVVVFADTFTAGEYSTAQSVVQQSFMQRLHESGSLVVDADSSRETRGGAQKKAKEEKDRFVVWMTLRYNGGMGAEPMGVRASPQNYSIEFAVYEPVTGKTRANGVVYMRAGYGTIGGVAVGAPSCYPTTYASDIEFVYGAIDAANRVMKAFDIPPPPLCGR